MATTDEVEHAAIREKLDEMHDDIKLLKKTMFVGNGKESVMVRLSNVENEIEDIAEDVAISEKEKKEQEAASKNTRSAMWVAVISGMLGIGAAVISLLA